MQTTTVYIPVIVSACTFLAILFLWWGVSLYLRQQAKGRTLKEKVHWGSEGISGVVVGGPASLGNEDAEANPFLGYIGKLGRLVASEQSERLFTDEDQFSQGRFPPVKCCRHLLGDEMSACNRPGSRLYPVQGNSL